MFWCNKEKTLIQDGLDSIPITHPHYVEKIVPRLNNGEIIGDYIEPKKEISLEDRVRELESKS